jgi:hypothetical protein
MKRPSTAQRCGTSIIMGIVGTNQTALDGTLTLAAGPLAIMRQGSISQTTTGFGDLYPRRRFLAPPFFGPVVAVFDPN